jgi:short-subunit dehydrogenase
MWARAGALGIVLAGRSVKKLEETAKGIREKYKEKEALVVKADVTIKEGVEEESVCGGESEI